MAPWSVLIVDDDALQRLDVGQSLTAAGLAVLEACDSDQALAILGARGDVRVMITDVDLRAGRLNGFQLAHHVAARWPELGLLIVSGRRRPRPADLPQGARFLAKPCQPSALVGAVFAFVAAQSGGI